MNSTDVNMIPFPLYHGTTSYFLSEILTYGLGGKNISVEWKIMEFFKEVHAALDKVDDVDFRRVFLSNKLMFDKYLAVVHNPIGFNYRYGSVYLSVDKKHAAHYSLRGFGSELARLANGWYCDLVRFSPNAALELIKRFPKIDEMFSADHRPVVIEINDLLLNEVATEGGLIGDTLRKQIAEWVAELELFGDQPDCMVGIAFEYIGAPLMKERLRLFNVSLIGNQSRNALLFNNILFTPIEIPNGVRAL